MDAMIDVETLSTKTEAAIVQLACVLFKPASGGEIDVAGALCVYVQLEGQARAVDQGALLLWLRQPDSVRLPLADGMERGDPLHFALGRLDAWWLMNRPQAVWAHGPSFDLAILCHAYSTLGGTTPWGHREERCDRTIADGRTIDSVGLERRAAERLQAAEFRKHDALHDAVYQALVVQEMRGG